MARIMGIEIGNTSIKMIETIKKGKAQTIKKASLIPVPKACIQNGVICQIEPIQEAIKEELRRKKYKAKKVVCVIQSSQIMIRSVEVEKYPKKAIRQLLEIKVEDFLPIEQGTYQIDFKILEEREEEGVLKNKLLLVAVPNTIVFPILDLIKNLKLIPVLISIPSEGLENIFNAEPLRLDGQLGSIMVLDIGGSSTAVTIITCGKVYLTRLIEYGVEDLKGFIKEAQELLGKGGEKVYRDNINNIISAQIEYHLISELERIFQFYYSKDREHVIDKIYTIGGGANIKEIEEHIKNALNIPIEKLSHLEFVSEAKGADLEGQMNCFVNLLGVINGM